MVKVLPHAILRGLLRAGSRRDKYNIEGAAPVHLSGDERVLWGIFKEIDTVRVLGLNLPHTLS